MDYRTPTTVAMYRLSFPEDIKEAEFRLSPDGTVSLTVLDPTAESLAQLIFEHGMLQVGGTSRATGKDGSAFMRSLLEPRSGGTYLILADESVPGQEGR